MDLLTLYSFPRQKANQYSIYPRTREMKIAELRRKLAGIPLFRAIYSKLRNNAPSIQQPSKYLKKGNNIVVLEDESKPVVSNELILSKITKEYDYFLLYGWQDMMSTSTVEAIYDMFHKPIIIACADMYQLTGNCFFTADCQGYKDECRNCHVFEDRPNKEQAHQNFLFKKRVYQKTGCYITVNSHLKKYFLKSGIIAEDHLLVKNATINTDIFMPKDRRQCKKKFGLDQDKIYLFLRYINPNTTEYNRKGMHLLKKSLAVVYSQLTDAERERVVIMFAGVAADRCEISYDFPTIAIGMLDIKKLINAYNASSVFVCPSIDDAGPTMVNQSIACGTPVIAFNQGTALDVLEDGYNGYKAEVGDYEAFAHCIVKMLRLSKPEYETMRENAREMSLRKNSLEAQYKQMKERFEYIDNHFQG